jgi:hypothetical protein
MLDRAEADPLIRALVITGFAGVLRWRRPVGLIHAWPPPGRARRTRRYHQQQVFEPGRRAAAGAAHADGSRRHGVAVALEAAGPDLLWLR